MTRNFPEMLMAQASAEKRRARHAPSRALS
jgi:hypothetical protein